MSERFASDLLFIVIALLIAAIIGFLMGYFLRKPKIVIKYVSKDSDMETPDFDAQAAKAVLGKKVIQDDLKIVEGIGPVIEGILKKNNIDTWKKLAGASKEKISSILIAEGGEKYKLHDPETWPKQAELAFKGKWEEMKKLQDKLLGGRQRE